MDLKEIYLTSLRLCDPELLVQHAIEPSMPRNVVAIGKCAGALLDGARRVHDVEDAFVAIPEGYRLPTSEAEVHVGGHPHMTAASFVAGRALLEFVRTHDDVLFLISGGGSACVEVPLPPHTEADLAAENARLIASGASIAVINARRRELSAIKGGRLGNQVRGRAVTLVYSDVSTGALGDVASGPTHPDRLIADNSTLVRAAASLIGPNAVVVPEQIEGDVDDAAQRLAELASPLQPGQILVAGGEPTVTVRGDGRGGRCSELAVRFAMRTPWTALFGSSDGVDGNSGVAGVILPPARARAARAELGTEHSAMRRSAEAALEGSDSYRIASQVGEPIMIAATGNNLRDLYLVARD